MKNASTLAIVGVDTAENGPSKVLQVTNRMRPNIGTKNTSKWSRPLRTRSCIGFGPTHEKLLALAQSRRWPDARVALAGRVRGAGWTRTRCWLAACVTLPGRMRDAGWTRA